jgi:hypothetical protein
MPNIKQLTSQAKGFNTVLAMRCGAEEQIIVHHTHALL